MDGLRSPILKNQWRDTVEQIRNARMATAAVAVSPHGDAMALIAVVDAGIELLMELQ